MRQSLNRPLPATGACTVARKVAVSLFTCGICRKSYNNPLGHVCSSRKGDFKRRQKAAKRKRKPPPHDYHTCRDPECFRLSCRRYREGYENGYEDGMQAGMEAGFEAGFAAGQAAAGE